jgi:hypothetical protein
VATTWTRARLISIKEHNRVLKLLGGMAVLRLTVAVLFGSNEASGSTFICAKSFAADDDCDCDHAPQQACVAIAQRSAPLILPAQRVLTLFAPMHTAGARLSKEQQALRA